MGALTWTTTLQSRGPAAAVVLDDEQAAVIGEGAKRFPVAATIHGETWRGQVTRMGGELLLGLSKAVRTQVAAKAGDEVEVHVSLDVAPREVDVPPALQKALDADPVARAAFDGLSPSRRKEHARSVAEAKQDATRERRLAKVLQALR